MPEPGRAERAVGRLGEAVAGAGAASRSTRLARPVWPPAGGPSGPAGESIRAVHRLEPDEQPPARAESEAACAEAQEALRPYPAVAHAGFLHDAEKEYAEAGPDPALVDGSPLPVGRRARRWRTPAWLNGLAEAASELRRHLLDRLRRGELDRAEELLAAMEDVYDMLVTVDFPDAITGGLRRTADALRAVLERTRSDVTTTLIQLGLRQALDRLDGDRARRGALGPATILTCRGGVAQLGRALRSQRRSRRFKSDHLHSSSSVARSSQRVGCTSVASHHPDRS